MRSVVITSGGLDSTVLCHYVSELNGDLHLVSFNYGQRHDKELDFAQKTADRLDTDWDLVDLSALSELWQGKSVLTTPEMEIPEGNYAAPNMSQTVVPNRNMMMLSIALAMAVNEGASTLYAGMHAGDHPVYPDCRPEFVRDFDKLARVANEGFIPDGFSVEAPFVNKTKADIVRLGADLEVPFEDTWSCYQGGDYHCGRCGTCVERAEAFFLACVDDPTVYEDSCYWRHVLGYIKD